MSEIVFEVTQEGDGGYVAECLTDSIVTQGDSWEELRRNVKEAVAAFYFDSAQKPAAIRLHFVRDGDRFVVQDHQLFSAQGQAGIGAAIVITKFDLENARRERLYDSANLPSA